jgi:hypothetical protein
VRREQAWDVRWSVVWEHGERWEAGWGQAVEDIEGGVLWQVLE